MLLWKVTSYVPSPFNTDSKNLIYSTTNEFFKKMHKCEGRLDGSVD